MIVRVLLSTGSSKGHARTFWKASEGCAIGSDYIMYTKLCADRVWATEARAEGVGIGEKLRLVQIASYRKSFLSQHRKVKLNLLYTSKEG